MRALLDVNVLIALLDADHIHHRHATDWMARHEQEGWASCPITQNGCIRIMSQPGYPNPLPVAAISERLGEATALPIHAFWPDDASILDEKVFDRSRILGSRQLTDAYLLALSVGHQGRFVTFDKGVDLAMVRSAERRHLLVLE